MHSRGMMKTTVFGLWVSRLIRRVLIRLKSSTKIDWANLPSFFLLSWFYGFALKLWFRV